MGAIITRIKLKLLYHMVNKVQIYGGLVYCCNKDINLYVELLPLTVVVSVQDSVDSLCFMVAGRCEF